MNLIPIYNASKKRRRDPSIVYDVTPLFTNVPADETIQLLAD